MTAIPTLSVHRDALVEYVEVQKLTLEASPSKGAKISRALGLRPLVVGSEPECDVCLTEPGVSRQHAQLALKSDGVHLRDLGSKNGTFVKGVRIIEAVVKPGDDIRVGHCALTLHAVGQAERVNLPSETHFGQALGASPSMRLLFAGLRRAAASDAPVLLHGESGTGKELLARAIHDHSPRRDKPFIIFDCGAVAPTLVEAELFGNEKGAYTGADKARVGLLESAHGGTVFLDEVGELPLDLQPKLLRALEARQIRPVGGGDYRAADARVICATHRDLRTRVESRQFREDLYFRLAVLIAEVPPLRERLEDLPLLVESFLAKQTPPRKLDALPTNALSILAAHSWPGNVRELWNTVTRWVLFPQMGAAVLDTGGSTKRLGQALDAVAHLPLREAREVMVEEFETQYLLRKLAEHKDNVTEVSKAAGVSRQFLYRLFDRYGLKEGRGRD